MKGYAKFSYIFTVGLVAYLLFHYVLWKSVAEDYLVAHAASQNDEKHGDMARFGYALGSSYDIKPFETPPGEFIMAEDYRGGPIDVITIGDSFSQGVGGSYYQDWISPDRKLKIMNFRKLAHYNSLETTVVLANSGYLDKVKPRYIILETSCKYVGELAGPQQFDTMQTLDWIKKDMAKVKPWFLPPLGFINAGNLKFLYHPLLYRFSDHAFDSKNQARSVRLDRPFFNVRNSDVLLYYFRDLEVPLMITDTWVKSINDNMNTLSRMLKKKGITLYFMPVVDKYDLYSAYIKDNRHPANPFFDILRGQKKEYGFIDTKAILSEELRKGERDTFLADDTHWGYKAARKIFSVQRFE